MPFHVSIERLICQPAPRIEQWCDWEGKPSDPATQYSLNVLSDVRHGRRFGRPPQLCLDVRFPKVTISLLTLFL